MTAVTGLSDYEHYFTLTSYDRFFRNRLPGSGENHCRAPGGSRPGTQLFHFYVKPQSISRRHLTAEFRVLDSAEKSQLSTELLSAENCDSPGLGQSFHDEHAGHHFFLRKMSFEIVF